MRRVALLLLLLAQAHSDLDWSQASADCSEEEYRDALYITDSPEYVITPPYNFDGVYLNNTECQFCPYHERPDDISALPAHQSSLMGMYGPCLDRQASMRLTCVQSESIHPPSLYGWLFFPDQRPLYREFGESTEYKAKYAGSGGINYNFPMHRLLQGDSNVDSNGAKKPLASAYGVSHLHYVNSFVNNPGLTRQFSPEDDYLWIANTQYLCDYGCHRNQSLVTISGIDAAYAANMAFMLKGVSGQKIRKCTNCPPGHFSYWWQDPTLESYEDKPLSQRAWPFTAQCWPFRGRIPQLRLKPGTQTWEMTPYPSAQLQWVLDYECPVNTYWRSCAHHFLKLANVNGTKPTCKPCPEGYHTDGQTGRWYCTPPAGQIFADSYSLQNDLVALRDMLWEPQCVMCQECQECLNKTMCEKVGNDAEAYNEAYIFKDLLLVIPCASGSYCPNARQDIVPETPCPANFSWSPEGSFSLLNCTCGAGFYRANSTACLPCTTTCSPGFMFSASNCSLSTTQRGVGAASDSPCVPCANIPPNAVAVQLASAYYFKDIKVGGRFITECNFQCNVGYFLTSDKQCGALNQLDAQGKPMYLLDSAEWPVFKADLYSSAVQQDIYDANARTTSSAVKSYVLFNRNNSALFARADKTCLSVGNKAYWAPKGWTWDSNLQCVACETPPAGIVFTAAALAWGPGKPGACEWRCANSSQQYLNGTTCVDCSSACPPSQRALGRGCGGSDEPVIACKNCTLSATSCAAGQWLNLNSLQSVSSAQGGCACEQCASLGSARYWKVRCSGTNAGGQAPWTLSCALQQYLTGANTDFSTMACNNCTTYKPYYQLPEGADCTPDQDYGWVPCPTGMYCPGNGSALPCPPDKTTLGEGTANAATDCFCKLGLVYNVSASACVTKACDNTTTLADRPGAVRQSPYYMQMQGDTTKCVLCGDGAQARGSMQGLGTCACSEGAVLNAAGQCIPCANLTGQCTQGQVPLSCAASTGTNRTACGCALPPFASRKTSSTCEYQCDALFAVTTDAPPSLTRNVSGSGLYTQAQWVPLLTAAGAVSAVHLTRNRYSMLLENTQVVVYSDSSEQIHVAVPGGSVIMSSYTTNMGYTVVGVACAPFTVQASNANLRNPYVAVGVVLADSTGTAHDMRLNTLYVAQDVYMAKNSTWTSVPAFAAGQVAHMAHLPQPWGLTTSGAFCLVYTAGTVRCQEYFATADGVVDATQWPPPYVLDLLSINGLQGTVQAAAMRGDVSLYDSNRNRVLYFVTSAAPDTVVSQQWQCCDGATLQYTTYVSTNALPLGWLAALGEFDPLLLTLGAEGQLLVTDSTQRQFVPIEGMPPLSTLSPTLGLSLTMENDDAQLVAATGSALFTLSLSFCSTQLEDHKRRYWNGSACVPVVCKRKPDCAANQHPNPFTNDCECNLGYYPVGASRTCQTCTLNNFCSNGGIYPCQSPLGTLNTGAPGPESCLCTQKTAQYYQSGTCTTCEAGYFCPNRWDRESCPGGSYQGSTVTQQLTPASCACAAGYTGAGCDPCPAGFYCPPSLTTLGYNAALVMLGTSLSNNATTCVANTLLKALKDNLGTSAYSSVWYHSVVRSDGVLTVSLLFQMQTSTARTNIVSFVPNYATSMFQNTLCGFTLSDTVPATGMTLATVALNVPARCPEGRVPAQGAASCTCAAGYQPDVTTTCAPCPVNSYKANPGQAYCDQCGNGMVAESTGATACTPQLLKPSSGAGLRPAKALWVLGAVVYMALWRE